MYPNTRNHTDSPPDKVRRNYLHQLIELRRKMRHSSIQSPRAHRPSLREGPYGFRARPEKRRRRLPYTHSRPPPRTLLNRRNISSRAKSINIQNQRFDDRRTQGQVFHHRGYNIGYVAMLQNLRAWGGPVRVMVRFAGQPPIIRDYGSMGEAKVDVKRMYRAFAPRAAHFVLAQGAMKR